MPKSAFQLIIFTVLRIRVFFHISGTVIYIASQNRIFCDLIKLRAIEIPDMSYCDLRIIASTCIPYLHENRRFLIRYCPFVYYAFSFSDIQKKIADNFNFVL